MKFFGKGIEPDERHYYAGLRECLHQQRDSIFEKEISSRQYCSIYNQPTLLFLKSNENGFQHLESTMGSMVYSAGQQNFLRMVQAQLSYKPTGNVRAYTDDISVQVHI